MVVGLGWAPEEVEVSRPSDALAAKQAADQAFTGLLLGLGSVALLTVGRDRRCGSVVPLLAAGALLGVATGTKIWGVAVVLAVSDAIAHDAIDAIELALADYEAMFGHPLVEACPVDPETGELLPVVTIVTDNGGPFRSFRFESFIAAHPELHHVRTRVKTPGQNGSRERGFGTLKYERLYLDEIDDAIVLAERAEDYRIEYNELRPHEAISWNRPKEVHLGLADPTTPTFKTKEILPTT